MATLLCYPTWTLLFPYAARIQAATKTKANASKLAMPNTEATTIIETRLYRT